LIDLFLPEPIRGWRVWKVADGRLYSTVFGTLWPDRARLEARCGLGGRSSPGGLRGVHDAPSRRCDCGIYALKSRKDAVSLALQISPPELVAVGRVSLWGRVVETERGYRAQYAYIYDLTLLGGTKMEANELQSRYAVDVLAEPVVDVRSTVLPAA
jgi:hypothetical protein